MTKDIFNTAKEIKLDELFTSRKFRTVREDGILSPGGVSEIRVIINMTEAFSNSLYFTNSSMRIIYGFAIMNDKLKEINKSRFSTEGIIKKVTFNDWGDKFTIVFDFGDNAKDEVYWVTSKEVKKLLEHCRVAPM